MRQLLTLGVFAFLASACKMGTQEGSNAASVRIQVGNIYNVFLKLDGDTLHRVGCDTSVPNSSQKIITYEACRLYADTHTDQTESLHHKISWTEVMSNLRERANTVIKVRDGLAKNDSERDLIQKEIDARQYTLQNETKVKEWLSGNGVTKIDSEGSWSVQNASDPIGHTEQEALRELSDIVLSFGSLQ